MRGRRWRAAGALAALGLGAAHAAEPPRTLDSIIVTARRLADEQLQARVEEALNDDRMFLATHVTVTVHDGVATLSGIVFDDWDMRNARRIARRIPGVKRVVNRLEIDQGGD